MSDLDGVDDVQRRIEQCGNAAEHRNSEPRLLPADQQCDHNEHERSGTGHGCEGSDPLWSAKRPVTITADRP